MQWPEFTILQCHQCKFRFIDTTASNYPTDAQYHYDELDDFLVNTSQSHLQRRVRDILEFKRPPGRALDIGCGKGELSLLLAESGFQCTGIDMKERLIRNLQANYPFVTWRCGMTHELEVEKEEFDLITMYHVLEHATKPVDCLLSLKKIARDGSLIVIEVPNVGGMEAKIKRKNWHYYKVDHVNYFQTTDLVHIAHLAGLNVLDIKEYQHFSYPQNIWWKDAAKQMLAFLGFKDVTSVFLRV